MWLKWLPWRFVLSHVARSQGFMDPINILSQFGKFSQPAEVLAPDELLRAGVIFHTRGLVNSQAIQHNLDWVWPFWVERQFDPHGSSFVPRAFSLTTINMTHRNWTAVGIPNVDSLPLVDPRGLLTPFFNKWSIDAWIVTDEKRDENNLYPSRELCAEQNMDSSEDGRVTTSTTKGDHSLDSICFVELQEGIPVARMKLNARSTKQCLLAVSIRPYNPEGISFIHNIAAVGKDGFRVDGDHRVFFSREPQQMSFSHYTIGDVSHNLSRGSKKNAVTCDVGMATAAAIFPVFAESTQEVEVSIPLTESREKSLPHKTHLMPQSWDSVMEHHCRLSVPDKHYQFLYEAAVRTTLLHTPGTVYAGPFTYKRFWFRDAAFVLQALLSAGFIERTEEIMDTFPSRQTATGYFESQNGEWDSNGQILWLYGKYAALTGRPMKRSWYDALVEAAKWIDRKRLPEDLEKPYAGLLPAGFSAEHLGPNDYYYWDDFWAVAGLNAASVLAAENKDRKHSIEFKNYAQSLMHSVERSLALNRKRLQREGIPSSPNRRLDSSAVGSLVCGYPLHLFASDDPRLLDTADYLFDNCLVHDAFFHDMTHSGINPYLTLHIAQVLLRNGDPRAFRLINGIAALASPTGHWPEAIHPMTRGGCMGDGQHVWAAAEWIMIVRNSFVLEEEKRDTLVLGSGIPREWLKDSQGFSYGPALTSFGKVSVSVTPKDQKAILRWDAQWRQAPQVIEIRLPGLKPARVDPQQESAEIALEYHS